MTEDFRARNIVLRPRQELFRYDDSLATPLSQRLTETAEAEWRSGIQSVALTYLSSLSMDLDEGHAT